MADKAVTPVLHTVLEDDEVVAARVDGISGRWFPTTWLGELLARAVVVVLTDSRVLVLDVSSFSHRDVSIRLWAPREAVRATFAPSFWRSSWLWGGKLRLVIFDEVVRVYVDRSSRDDARLIADALFTRE
jgi:hypothetical protein